MYIWKRTFVGVEIANNHIKLSQVRDSGNKF